MFFINVLSSSLIQDGVDTTDGFFWGLNFDQEDWLLESWFTTQVSSEHGLSGSWNDLTGTSVDGISVEGNIDNVKSDSSHILISQWSF